MTADLLRTDSSQRRGPQEDRLLSVADTAEVLQISSYTLRQWAREGKVPAVQLGRYWRFRRSSLDAWVESQEKGGR